jgi:acetoin utilization deacetylase AcuC-like enzyme
MTLLYTDPLFLRHETGAHPERPERLRAVAAQLAKSGTAGRCTLGVYELMSETEITELHDRRQVFFALRICESGGGLLDGDTAVSAESFTVARAAAGACASAVDAVMLGKDRNALCLVRPPGHHATPTTSMGFCLFNNIALAAQRARKEHGLTRLLIVDWDVHHGNGTQDIFYADSGVQFFSIHRYGGGFYPGSGAADETGTGPGLGRTLNIPLPFGVSRRDYHAAFAAGLEKAADAIKPELVLLSAGFDAHAADPIGSLGLEVEDFAEMTKRVLDVANVHAGGRLVSCLEGGYDLEALAASVQAHLEELLAVGRNRVDE